MILKISVPEAFVPEEREYQIYCAIKLFKGEYVTKEEAVEICGYGKLNKETEEKFKAVYGAFEKRYKKICGYGYADGDFQEDMEEEKKKKKKN